VVPPLSFRIIHHRRAALFDVRTAAVLAQVDADRGVSSISGGSRLEYYIWSPPPLVPFHNRFSCAESTLLRNQH
jgi:hypothetical protein